MTSHRGTRREGGFILIYTAFLFPFLVAFTAMAVDMGTWYVQGQTNQRTADAAALAGVVWLPDMTKATQVVRDTATRNGYQDGVNATVVVERAGPNELRVKIGTASRQYFSQLFVSEFAITRSAVAEYIPPVALGSPKNSLGTGDLASIASPDGYWLAASGFCSVTENGDLRLARYRAAYLGNSYPPSCANAASRRSPDYNSDGYVFAIRLEAPLAQPLYIDVWDGTYQPDPGSKTDIELARVPASQQSEFRTDFRLYAPDSTPYDLSDNLRINTSGNPQVADSVRSVNARVSSWREQWQTIRYVSNPVAGTYFLRVQTTNTGGNRSYGSNGFAIRARVGGTFVECSTIPGSTAPPYSATCPQVYAVNDLPVYASISGLTTDFYLAEIDPRHGGKTLQVTLFDAGEGAEEIRILDPNGNPAAFTWTTDCTPPIVAPAGGCSGSGTVLDVSGTGAQPGGNRISASKYNDRSIVLSIDLPTNYSSVYAGNWWKVRYTSGAVMTDRSTWSVKVIGDPIRLAS